MRRLGLFALFFLSEIAVAPSPDRLVDVVAKEPLDARFRRVADGVAVGRVPESELGSLARRDPSFAVLPEMHRATNLAIPIIGVPTVEAAGFTGKGTYVGVVDSGFDVRHSSLRDANGKTRFAWLLDYSQPPRGKHPELEALYARDDKGAIWSGDEIDALLDDPSSALPTDGEGHGTLAMSIAAGSHLATTEFRGVAADAKLVGVKSDGGGYTVNAGSVLQGVEFIFDRAKDAGVPAAVNLSLSSDFSVRDGTDPLGPAVAALTRGQGRIIVVAAGNAGDPVLGTHQTVSVAEGEQVKVRLHAVDNLPYPHVQVLVSPHANTNIRVGCASPKSPWVTPIPRGQTRSAALPEGIANVVFNPADYGGRLPASSSSAIVLMDGQLATDKDQLYSIVLEGAGTADMWITGGYFEHGVREQTVGSPANHPEIIAVGASVSRTGFRTLAGEDLVLRSQVYDEGGLVPLAGVGAPPAPGQIASFSGAGPGPGGVIKPDLVAPGVSILAAATGSGDERSIVVGTTYCPSRPDGTKPTDDHCLFVDADHAAATGTSFAAPFVTGAAAILLQADPTLGQEEMRIALQAGVHRHRSAPRFPESASVGELDVPGALEVARRLRNPVAILPAPDQSWVTANSHYAPSDGTRPLEVLVHLRASTGEPADGFDVNRFSVAMTTSEERVPPTRLRRLGPGLWSATFEAGKHGSGFAVSIEASFDGRPAATPLSLPIALDPWQASYPTEAKGATCAFGAVPREGSGAVALALASLLVARRRRS